jgi:hypothetical protein
LDDVFPKFGFSGELYGEANLTLSAAKLAQLAAAPRLEGTFEAKKVVINKIDMETIARFGSRSDLGRGQTSLDEIKGTLHSDSRGQRLSQLSLSSSVLSGSGLAEVSPEQEISGKLALVLKGPGGGNVPLILTGTLAQPVVKAR